jgi:ribosome maturation factor RimP
LNTIDRIREIAGPLLVDRGLEVYDVERHGPVVRVTVESPEDVDLDLDALSQITRALSLALDEHDPVSGRYTLEVSSPGLERRLRTPQHFERAVGTAVTVKTRTEVEGRRRFSGTLAKADAAGIVVADEDDHAEHRLSYGDIDAARTVFEWGPTADTARSNKKAKKQTTTVKAASS